MGFDRLYRSVIESIPVTFAKAIHVPEMYACNIQITSSNSINVTPMSLVDQEEFQHWVDSPLNDFFIIYKGPSFNEAFHGVLKGLQYFDAADVNLLDIITSIKSYKHLKGDWAVLGRNNMISIAIEIE